MDRRVMIKKMKTSTPVKGLVKVPYTRTPGMHRFCFSETTLALKRRDKSAFAEFGSAAIFGKWYWNEVRLIG